MKLGVITEPEGENRVAIVPNSIPKLSKAGFEILVESGAGNLSSYSDVDFESKGAHQSAYDRIVRISKIYSVFAFATCTCE